MSFGKRITYIRGSRSQEDFGSMLGVHRNTVRTWECNEIMPKGGIIKDLFEIFNINLHWLFSGKGEPYFENINLPGDNINSTIESDNE